MRRHTYKLANPLLLERWINLANAEEILEAVDFPSSGFHRKISKSKLGANLLDVKSISVRGLPNTFLLLSEQDRQSAYACLGKSEGEIRSSGKDYTIPGEPAFEAAREILIKDQQRHRFFFDWAINHKCLNRESLTKIFDSQGGYMGIIVDGFHAGVGNVAVPFSMTIQDYIEIECILKPAFNLSDTTFEMLRGCPICDRIFHAKNSLAKFCSSKCRGVDFRKKN